MTATSPSNTESVRLVSGEGAKIPQAFLQKRKKRKKTQNINQKQYCDNFNKDFKNGPQGEKIL